MPRVAPKCCKLHQEDPFAPPAMRAFFEMLYARKGKPELDRPGVLDLCADHAGDMNFPFESIAAAMRFIDDAMVPVIVAKEEAERQAKSRGLSAHCALPKASAGSRGSLGAYTVGVPRAARNAMIAAGVAEVIRPERVRRPVRGAAQPRLYTQPGDETRLDDGA